MAEENANPQTNEFEARSALRELDRRTRLLDLATGRPFRRFAFFCWVILSCFAIFIWSSTSLLHHGGFFDDIGPGVFFSACTFFVIMGFANGFEANRRLDAMAELMNLDQQWRVPR